VSVGYALGRLRFSKIISHPKKCRGRGSRLDLDNRNQCEYSKRNDFLSVVGVGASPPGVG